MEFIPPSEIASKVMTLLREAKKEIIIVSPYVNVTDWEKMKKSLAKAIENNVTIKFFVRKGTNDNLIPLKELGINPIKIENLHAKVYINENYAIATSQNIIEYSDKYSIDFGYKTKTVEERKELIDFVNTYVDKIDYNEFEVDEVIANSLNCKIVIENSTYEHKHSEIKNKSHYKQLSDKFHLEFEGFKSNQKNRYLYFSKINNSKTIPNTSYLHIDNYYTLSINIEKFNYKKFAFYFTNNNIELLNNYSLRVSNEPDYKHKFLSFINISENSNFEDLITDYITITKIILDNDFKIA